MGELRKDQAVAANRTVTIEGTESGFATTKFESILNWARKYSLFQYPFVTACCAMEFMSLASPRFDMARFGPRLLASRRVSPICCGSWARSASDRRPSSSASTSR